MRLAFVLPLLVAAIGAAEPAPAQPAADPDAYTARVSALEAEIRALVEEQSKAAGPAGAAVAADYAAAKARAGEDVRRRLQFVEYYLANNDYTRAVDACNAILVDHPHEPATVRLKYRILTAMVGRERAIIERERAYRNEESLADAQARGILPKDGPRIARTFLVFDEDVEEAERAAVRRKLQERVTLNYDGVVVGEVLKPLFAIAGINYVILDRALSSETLTLHLVDDTVENALKTIAKLVDVRYNYSGNTVFIGAADSEVMVSEIIRLSSGLTDVVTELQTMEPASGGEGGGGAATPAQPQPQQQGQNGQASTDLERFLEKVPDIVAGWPEDGKMYLDRKSNTLYVRSTPAAIGELKRLLRALDYHSAQVLIETRFVEVLEGAERSLGVDWGFAGSNGTFTLGGPMGGGVQTPTAGLTFQDITTPIAAGTAGSGGLNLGMLFSPSGNLGIKAAIQALESEEKAEQLAEPRILTLNNSIGNIRLTQSVSYIKSYTYSNTTSDSVTDNNGNVTNVTNSNPQPEWGKDYEGITLRIRPSIARNSDIITIEVQPTVRVLLNRNTTTIRVQTGSNTDTQQPLNVENPDFRTRTLATTLHIRNGQTVVLGGLTQDNTTVGDSGVPGVRTVPFLGRLFSKKASSMTRSNLLIFVTAHIIDPSGAKIGEDIVRLRDTAAVVLPEEARQAEAESRAGEAQRAADAAAAARAAGERKPVPAQPAGRTGTRR